MMAEDQGKQDEPKLEFDSAGQAIAYISPDQARALAFQLLATTWGFYGCPYTVLCSILCIHQQQGVTGVSGLVFV